MNVKQKYLLKHALSFAIGLAVGAALVASPIGGAFSALLAAWALWQLSKW